ncbi:hypothetical protein GCM10010329_82100 [Streptomyces spiroverticillatus]|uniref:Uncharacterized protein n=1 Tax=Streptomyces finlayi TaxID=67296 RepID=A0A918X8I9_9ACTN|nr:hypothetical protein GCM10010329_82100 [Streptomyces spiroverticillatus]GHD18350.1 hypothetical protein GCM10010334_81180 [Streptomyces finlayi]
MPILLGGDAVVELLCEPTGLLGQFVVLVRDELKQPQRVLRLSETEQRKPDAGVLGSDAGHGERDLGECHVPSNAYAAGGIRVHCQVRSSGPAARHQGRPDVQPAMHRSILMLRPGVAKAERVGRP